MRVIHGLYGMADAGFGDPVAQAWMLAEEGVEVIQLRAKGWTSAARAEALRHFPPVQIVVNDDVRVARDFGAWAHLGQEDGPDPALSFGRSTHTVAQATESGAAAYVGFGPVFGTHTKSTGYDPRGVALLAEVVRCASVPVVAIGGIGLAELDAVRATGVAGWAVVGAIWRSPDPRAVIRALRR